MTTAAIYARKSTAQNGVADEERSVTRQVESGREYAESKGWRVDDDHIYVDGGVSGAEFNNRPGLVRLMNAVNGSAPFDRLVVMDESRLGREQIETAYVLKQLAKAGVEVWCYLEDRQRTLDSPTDKIMLALTTYADELEREKARQRTKDAMVRKAKRGHVCGGRCFGYENVDVAGPDGERSHVERRVNEEEAVVVRRIFELTADGYGQTRIAHKLNEEGLPSPRAQQDRPNGWAPSTVRTVQHRESYRGVVVWNQSKKRDQWGQRHTTTRPEEDHIRVEMPELRIVSEELWERAHRVMGSRRANYIRHQDGRLWGRPPSGTASKYLLTAGIAVCAGCGASLTVRSRSHGRKRFYHYQCSANHRKGRAICTISEPLPMKLADEAVLDVILSKILTPERLQEVSRRAVELAREEVEGAGSGRDRMEGDLRAIEERLARLVDALESGAGAPALVERINELEGRRETLVDRLEALERPVPEIGPEIEERLSLVVEEWRELLGRQVGVSRQILGKLLTEKLVFTAPSLGDEEGWSFNGVGTLEPLLAGAIPELPQPLVSPTGFEPVLPA